MSTFINILISKHMFLLLYFIFSWFFFSLFSPEMTSLEAC